MIRGAALVLAAAIGLCPVLASAAAQTEVPALPGLGILPFLPGQDPAQGEENIGGAGEWTGPAGKETLSDEMQEVSPEDAVSVHLAGEPGEPLPYRVLDTDTASLLKLVSEGLVTLDENGDPAPGSAESWKVSGDGLKWTFSLRDDLRWADGEPMEAKDFAELFRKIADPATEALYGADLMRGIEGYEDVLNGDSTALGVHAEGDHKLVVRLNSPDPDFARKCASWALLPIREQIREDTEDDVTADWMQITGNGPYYIASVEEGQEYLLKKNPNYYGCTGAAEASAVSDTGAEEEGGAAVPFEEVRWKVSGDSNEEYSDFLNGGIDAIAQIPEEEEEELKSSEVLADYQTQVTPETLGIFFNCDREALQDPQVRRALTAAIDSRFIAEDILDNVYAPADDAIQTDDGLARAEELLAQAGHENGKGIPALTCVVDENGGAYNVAEYLASVWQDLGIEVKVEKEDAQDLAQEKTAGTFDILCGNICLASDLPEVELERFVSSSEENVTGFSSEKYDRAMEKAAKEEDSEDYQAHLEDAQKILEEELPIVPLAQRRVSWLRRENADGIFCDAAGCWQLWNQTAQAGPDSGQSETAAVGVEKKQAAEDTPDQVWKTESPFAGAGESSLPEIGKDPAGSSPALPDAENLLAAGPETDRAGTGDSDKDLQTGSPVPDTPLAQLQRSAAYYEKTDTTGYLTRQAWVLETNGPGTERLYSLPKYAEVHLVGTGNTQYVRIEQDGQFRYLETDHVTADAGAVDAVRAAEAEERLEREVLSVSMHRARESELALRASDVRAETERILEEIAHREMLRTQTRNPSWNGSVLSRGNGSVTGPSGKETYYNLNMNGVVSIMRRMGNTDEYWVRDDGCKMLGDYIMCAANLRVHPRGSLVESSLGTCIVCDTGGFASRNANQLDIAVTW